MSLAATFTATKRTRLGESKIRSIRSDYTHPPVALTPLLSCSRQRQQPFFSSASLEEASWHQASERSKKLSTISHGQPRQSQDHQVAYVSCGAARARDPHMSTQLSRQNKRRHTTRCSSTAAAQALALSARGLPALAHVLPTHGAGHRAAAAATAA